MRIALDEGFEPGRIYEIDYPATGAKVAGAGMAAIRDAASAFRYRADMPVRGRSAYIFGASQSGRFLRQFLHDGFNADEEDRRAFDLVWPHIAGAGRGSFNERFAAPGYNTFPATQFPYTDLEQAAPDGSRDGILAAYRADQMPKVIYTNTSVEYWGLGRSAALTHLTVDGTRDAAVPENVRIYHLAGTQHGEAAFPPTRGTGQALGIRCRRATSCGHCSAPRISGSSRTRVRQTAVTRMLRDQTLVPLKAVGFPAIPGVSDPRTIEGPGPETSGHFTALPFLVPASMLTATRSLAFEFPNSRCRWPPRQVGTSERSASAILRRSTRCSASYIPFARTKAERDARHDPRPLSRRTLSRSQRLPAEDSGLGRGARQRSLAASGRCRRRRRTRDAALGARDRDDSDELGS